MPQPIELRSYSMPNQALLARPKLAAFVGAIASEWTQVEQNLAALLAGAFGTTTRNADGAFSINNNWLGQAAISKSETIRVRLKILDATLGELLRGTSVEEGWTAIRNELTSRSKERNKIVHAVWALADELPDDLLMVEASGRLLRYRGADFQDALNRISDLRSRCHELLLKVLGAVHEKEIAQRLSGPMVLSDALWVALRH